MAKLILPAMEMSGSAKLWDQGLALGNECQGDTRHRVKVLLES